MELFRSTCYNLTQLSKVPDTSLTLRALKCELALRNPAPGCIHHSDRGVQYACTATPRC